MPFSAVEGVITSEEFEIVRIIYSEIASMPWFTASVERREQFALIVLDTFRQGCTAPDELKETCLAIARQSFGNGGLT